MHASKSGIIQAGRQKELLERLDKKMNVTGRSLHCFIWRLREDKPSMLCIRHNVIHIYKCTIPKHIFYFIKYIFFKLCTQNYDKRICDTPKPRIKEGTSELLIWKQLIMAEKLRESHRQLSEFQHCHKYLMALCCRSLRGEEAFQQCKLFQTQRL